MVKDPKHALGKTKLFAAGLAVLAALLMAGCGAGTSGSGATAGSSGGSTGNGSVPGVAFKGQVDGGGPQNPIANSTVTLYAMGPAGSNCSGASCYGANASQLTQTTSNTSGAFTFGSYTCPTGNPETYVVVTGGNPGSGTNSAIGLMALTGPCNNLSSSTFVVVNELTTAAAQWSLAQFTDPAGQMIGTSSTNATGLANAVNLAMSDLVKSIGTDTTDSGIPASFLPWSSSSSTCTSTTSTSNCDGLERLDTLANVLAACVNSSGPGSTPCTDLYDATGGSGAPPSTWTTLEAAHEVVTNPATNVSSIYSLQTNSTVAPFQPDLSSAPATWALGLNFAPSGAELDRPGGPALDATGNVWVADSEGGTTCGLLPSAPCGSMSELTAASGYTTGQHFNPSGAAFVVPVFPLVDTNGNVWVDDVEGGAGCSSPGLSVSPCGSVSELTASSSFASGSNFAPSGAQFDWVGQATIDGAGNVWAVNAQGGKGCSTTNSDSVAPCGSVSELTASSSYTTGLNFAPIGASIDYPNHIAIDSAGNAWVANYFGGSGCSSTAANSVAPCGSVSELIASSSHTSGANFSPTAAEFDVPDAIAFDDSGNAWEANRFGGSGCSTNATPCGSVSELTASSSYASGTNFAPSGARFDGVDAIALDSAGNVWVLNGNEGSGCPTNASLCGSLSELTATSSYATGFNFAPAGAAVDYPGSMKVDSSGNIWITNTFGGSGCATVASPCGSVSMLVGLAKPVLTPAQACLKANKNVCLP